MHFTIFLYLTLVLFIPGLFYLWDFFPSGGGEWEEERTVKRDEWTYIFTAVLGFLRPRLSVEPYSMANVEIYGYLSCKIMWVRWVTFCNFCSKTNRIAIWFVQLVSQKCCTAIKKQDSQAVLEALTAYQMSTKAIWKRKRWNKHLANRACWYVSRTFKVNNHWTFLEEKFANCLQQLASPHNFSVRDWRIQSILYTFFSHPLTVRPPWTLEKHQKRQKEKIMYISRYIFLITLGAFIGY